MKIINEIVKKCEDCPYNVTSINYEGCSKSNREIIDNDYSEEKPFPDWCPLENYKEEV